MPHTHKLNLLRQAILYHYRLLFILLLSFSGLAILAEVYASIIFRNWVNRLSSQEIDQGILLFGFLIPLFYSISWLFNAAVFKFDIEARYLVYKFAFDSLVAHQLNRFVDLFQREKPGHIMQNIRNASEAVSNIFNMLAFYGFRFVVILIASIVLLGEIAWWSPILIIGISLLFLYISFQQHQRCITRSKVYVNRQGITSGNLVEIFERIRIVKTYQQEARIGRSASHDIKQEGEAQKRLRGTFLQLNLIQIGYKMGIIFLFLGIGTSSYAAGRIELGSLAMLITFSMTLSNTVEELSTRIYELINNFTRYQEVLSQLEKESINTGQTVTSATSKPDSGSNRSPRLIFDKVHIPATDGYILRNLNLSFPLNGKVVLTGPSGCGKSSLAEAILGLKRFEGKIGISRQIREGATQAPFKIVEVEQTPMHLGKDIHAWVTFGNQSASADLIKKALDIAGIEEFVRLTDNKIELKPGRRLHSLSGGERQRVAVARAIVSEPDYIIFDEPTSALDPATTDRLFKQIAELHIGMLIITHDHQQLGNFGEVYTYRGSTFQKLQEE